MSVITQCMKRFDSGSVLFTSIEILHIKLGVIKKELFWYNNFHCSEKERIKKMLKFYVCTGSRLSLKCSRMLEESIVALIFATS